MDNLYAFECDCKGIIYSLNKETKARCDNCKVPFFFDGVAQTNKDKFMFENNKGMTLQDLITSADLKGISPKEIFLITSDGNPITSLDIPEETPDLWFLGDNAYDYTEE